MKMSKKPVVEFEKLKAGSPARKVAYPK